MNLFAENDNFLENSTDPVESLSYDQILKRARDRLGDEIVDSMNLHEIKQFLRGE